MRSFLLALAGLMLFAAGAAQAKVAITVDKDTQQMTVAVDGVERYQLAGLDRHSLHETPNGSFRTFRMEEDHFSKEFDDAPMPHSIFFTKTATPSTAPNSDSRLGTPASHGCVRLSRANATTLYALVEERRRAQHHRDADRLVADRARAQSAAAQRPRRPPRRRAPQHAPQYDAAGDPVVMTPPGQMPADSRAQVAAPTTATSIRPTAARTGALSGAAHGRRLYDAQAYPQPQPYYDNRGYAPPDAPQAYAPRPYQPRGLFG